MALEEVTHGISEPPLVKTGPATEIISGAAGWAVLHKVADSGVSRFEAEFVKTVARASNNIQRTAIRTALKNRNRKQALDIAVNAWNGATPAFKAQVEASVVSTVAVAARRVSERVLTNPSAIQFDVTNPLATKWAREQSSLLVTNISSNQRKTLQNIITQGFEEGLTPQKISRNIRSGIGLQSRQQIALNRFEQDLVRQGIKPSTVTKRVNSYKNKLIRQRSRAIARTELMRASNMGQQLLWEEAVAQGHMNPAVFQKVWITTPDDRLCPYCRAKSGERVGLFDNFNNPVGTPQPQPPLHPMCRCSTAAVRRRAKMPKTFKAPTRSTPTTGKVTKPKLPKPKPKPKVTKPKAEPTLTLEETLRKEVYALKKSIAAEEAKAKSLSLAASPTTLFQRLAASKKHPHLTPKKVVKKIEKKAPAPETHLLPDVPRSEGKAVLTVNNKATRTPGFGKEVEGFVDDTVQQMRNDFKGLGDLQLDRLDLVDEIYTSGRRNGPLGRYNARGDSIEIDVNKSVARGYGMKSDVYHPSSPYGPRAPSQMHRMGYKHEIPHNQTNKFAVDLSAQGVARHEIGHAVHYKYVGMQDDLWRGIKNKRYSPGRFPKDPSLPKFDPERGLSVEWNNLTEVHRSRASYDWDNIYRKRVSNAKKAGHSRGRLADPPPSEFVDKVGEGVSRYAGYNERELFAESWTVYSDPRYVTGELKQLPLDIHNWMTRYFPRS